MFLKKIKETELGRSITEMLAVIAIVAILSLGALAGFRQAMVNQTVNSLVQAVNLGSIQALTALTTRIFKDADEMDEFLKQFKTTVYGYVVDFKAPRDQEFNGTEFVAKITTKEGQKIKGKMCRKILTTMVEVNGVSDVDFSIENVEDENGIEQTVTMRLSGKAVDLDAICGQDVL